MKKFRVVFLALSVLLCVFFSCETTGAANSKSAAKQTSGEETGAASGLFITSASRTRASEDLSPDQEYYIGRAVAATILETYRIYNAPAFTEYLNDVMMTLAANSPMPEIYNGYHAAILDTIEINAFATSGGHILITRGLLAAADSEDALAAVLAHEMAHIQLKHSIKAIRSNISMDDMNKALGDSATDAVSAMTKGYSPSQEYDADKYALTLMVSAGYDPKAMTEMLAALQNRYANSRGGFILTHPKATDRLTRVNTELTKPDYQNLKINGRNERNARYAKSKIQ